MPLPTAPQLTRSFQPMSLSNLMTSQGPQQQAPPAPRPQNPLAQTGSFATAQNQTGYSNPYFYLSALMGASNPYQSMQQQQGGMPGGGGMGGPFGQQQFNPWMNGFQGYNNPMNPMMNQFPGMMPQYRSL